MKTVIEMKSIVKTYDTGSVQFNALDGIDCSIEEGEFVVILGPSGAGKSTLLNLIGGMDVPSQGSIQVSGEDISKYSQKELSTYRAKNVGFIFQFYNILPTLTVKENVELVQDIVEDAMDAETVLDQVGLKMHMNQFPNQLSGGEQQRVSIARALAKKPKLLLCDEPTGALDSKTGTNILELLKAQKTTVIIVTHNALIADIADRVIRLKNGKIIENVKNENPKSVDEVSW